MGLETYSAKLLAEALCGMEVIFDWHLLSFKNDRIFFCTAECAEVKKIRLSTSP